MQGVTRNPLADPGILGVNAGAALFVVIGITVFGVTSIIGYVWFAFAGAAVAAVVVYSIAALGREGATPVKLALAGAALSAALGAVTTAFLLLDQATFDQFRFWQVGALAGRDLPIVAQVAPFLIVGSVLRPVPRADAERPVARRGRGPRARRQRRGRPGCLGRRRGRCSAARRPRPAARSASSA